MSKRANTSYERPGAAKTGTEHNSPESLPLRKGTPLNPLDHAIVIDPEFADLLPPQGEDENALLTRQLVTEGCRDELVIWRGHNILLEGHHRLPICRKYGILYEVEEIDLPDRKAARDWVINKQLGQRNLHPEAVSYLRGKRYNAEKQTHGGDRTANEASSHPDHLRTAEWLADEFKVSPRTIQRDGEYAAAVDTLVESCGKEVKAAVLCRGSKVTRAQVLKAAKEDAEGQKKWFEGVRAGQGTGPERSREAPETLQLPADPKALAGALVDRLGTGGAVAVHRALHQVLATQGSGS